MATQSKKEKFFSRRLRIILFLLLLASLVAAVTFGFLKIRALLLTENPRLVLRNVEINSYAEGYWEKHTVSLKNELGLVEGKNLFLFSPAEIRKKLLKKANLADAEVEILLPDTIRLTLAERIPCALLDRSHSPWVADYSGMILKKSETTADKLSLPVIVEARKIPYENHYTHREKRKVLIPALTLCAVVREHFPNLKVMEVHITPNGALEAQLSYFNQPVCYVMFRGDGTRREYIFWVERFLDAINAARRHGDLRNHFDLRFDAQITIH